MRFGGKSHTQIFSFRFTGIDVKKNFIRDIWPISGAKISILEPKPRTQIENRGDTGVFLSKWTEKVTLRRLFL